MGGGGGVGVATTGPATSADVCCVLPGLLPNVTDLGLANSALVVIDGSAAAQTGLVSAQPGKSFADGSAAMQPRSVSAQPEESFADSLKKALPTPLLQTPAPPARKVRGMDRETQSEAEAKGKRKSTRLANKPKSNLTMEEQATWLLMKKCGTLDDIGPVSSEEKSRFREEFVEPLAPASVSGYRGMFGLDATDGSNPLSALAVEAEV
ncbi:hypothetical protein C2845_PM07G31260 [Panicum miliaceum]|uniref:Uncharacterized protein n=1 Tax=Panicum miliaceum TaxID=4540 RepID=A0A3L6SQQ0_PANMI|nr:hypothetical protein C2845_PM07G31260 [Panicum miliaceum]